MNIRRAALTIAEAVWETVAATVIAAVAMVRLLATHVQSRLALKTNVDEASTVEKVILVGIFALLAIAVGGIIVTKVTQAAHNIQVP
jgi:hypothetical protein